MRQSKKEGKKVKIAFDTGNQMYIIHNHSKGL